MLRNGLVQSKIAFHGNTFRTLFEVSNVLTEQQIQTSFRRLFQAGADISPDLLDKADGLIDQLRLESPLRHRLSEELEEIREMVVAKKN